MKSYTTAQTGSTPEVGMCLAARCRGTWDSAAALANRDYRRREHEGARKPGCPVSPSGPVRTGSSPRASSFGRRLTEKVQSQAGK